MQQLCDVFATASYSHPQFQNPGLFVDSGGTDFGVDSNADGKFDLLHVRPQVFASIGGTYHWSARLVDVDGNSVDVISGSTVLAAGDNVSPKKVPLLLQPPAFSCASSMPAEVRTLCSTLRSIWDR